MSLIQMLERFELLSCSLLAAQATSRERFKGAQALLPAFRPANELPRRRTSLTHAKTRRGVQSDQLRSH
jgi:hypothetical protein